MQWEYKTMLFEFTKDGLLRDRYVDDEEMEENLNQLGRQGWELVNVSLLQDGLFAFLKRPVAENSSILSEVSPRHQVNLEENRNQTPSQRFQPENNAPPIIQPPPRPVRSPRFLAAERLQEEKGQEGPASQQRQGHTNNDRIGGIRIR